MGALLTDGEARLLGAELDEIADEMIAELLGVDPDELVEYAVEVLVDEFKQRGYDLENINQVIANFLGLRYGLLPVEPGTVRRNVVEVLANQLELDQPSARSRLRAPPRISNARGRLFNDLLELDGLPAELVERRPAEVHYVAEHDTARACFLAVETPADGAGVLIANADTRLLATLGGGARVVVALASDPFRLAGFAAHGGAATIWLGLPSALAEGIGQRVSEAASAHGIRTRVVHRL